MAIRLPGGNHGEPVMAKMAAPNNWAAREWRRRQGV
jgi:hypothetical protein